MEDKSSIDVDPKENTTTDGRGKRSRLTKVKRRVEKLLQGEKRRESKETDVTPLRGELDEVSHAAVRGWFDRAGPCDRVEVYLDGRKLATLSPTAYREDLERAGHGDGCRSFALSLEGYLRTPEATVRIDVDGKRFAETQIEKPDLRLSQKRWRDDEPDVGLTWGVSMTGDSLVDLYCRHRSFAGGDRILEIGPGYGRILKAMRARALSYGSYVGVDLSAARVARLNAGLGDDRTRFVQGDVNEWRDADGFDVVVCSSTFEHLFPNCSAALHNLRSQLRPGATLFIDFIDSETDHETFEGSGTFIRWYSEPTLRALFEAAGLDVTSVERLEFGPGSDGRPIWRLVFVATVR